MFVRHFLGDPINIRRIVDGDDGGAAPDAAPVADPTTPPVADPAGKTFTQEELDRLVEQRLTRERKKYADYDSLKASAKELEAIKAASATDMEKAVQQARDEERAKVVRDFGLRTVHRVMKAQLAQSMKPADADALLDDLNLGKFVSEDGEIDDDAIAKTVARLAPRGPVDLGQGSRGDGPSIDQQIREAKKSGNWQAVIALENRKHLSSKS